MNLIATAALLGLYTLAIFRILSTVANLPALSLEATLNDDKFHGGRPGLLTPPAATGKADERGDGSEDPKKSTALVRFSRVSPGVDGGIQKMG